MFGDASVAVGTTATACQPFHQAVVLAAMLMRAICAGRQADVEALVRMGVDPLQGVQDGALTPIAYAAVCGSQPIFEILYAAGKASAGAGGLVGTVSMAGVRTGGDRDWHLSPER